MRLGIGLVLLCAGGSAEAHRCFVRSHGGFVEKAWVAPRGARPFRVGLSEVPMLAVPAGAGARIHVLGPLAFRASVARVEYGLVRRVDTARGMIRLGAEARLAGARPIGERARGVAKLLGTVQVHEVTISCDALTLDEPDAIGTTTESDPVPEGATFLPARRAVVLRERAGGGASIRLTAGSRDELFLVETEARGPWRRVLFDDGDSRVEGWTPKAALVPSDGGMTGTGIGDSFGGCGSDGGFFGTDVFDGSARIRFGTTVFAAPGRAPWGSIRTDDAIHVVHERGSAWAQVADVPGIDEECGSLLHAWVSVQAVEFPASASPRE